MECNWWWAIKWKRANFIFINHRKKKCIKTLEQNELWFSNPRKFNDPFELKYCLNNPAYSSADADYVLKHYLDSVHPDKYSWVPRMVDDELLHKLRQLMSQPAYELVDRMYMASNLINEHLHAELSKYGILCLSKVFMSELMWAYYAKSHTGYMITYERSGLSMTRNFENGSEAQILPFNVDYRSDRPVLDVWKLLFTDCLKEIFGTKSLQWSHEDEVRYAVNLQEPFNEA